MTNLQTWMKTHNYDDAQLAERVGVSRVQISRIRRKLSGASAKTAIRLNALTGLELAEFIGPEVPLSSPDAVQQNTPANGAPQDESKKGVRNAETPQTGEAA